MDDKQLRLSSQICFPIYSASRLITKAYKPYLDEIGLTYPQYLVLLVLWENDELTVNQISEKLLLNTNTLSPLLKRMGKMELLERNRSHEDERSVIVQLTEKGKQLKMKALPIPEKLVMELLSDNIKIEEMLKLKDILSKLIFLLTNKSGSSDKA
ncbi:MarR family winged helix-turn-helix transcriptional regulator [Labilibaculum antarcticum]|uniref:MarR family transcriptional regulator n=1 Tax=Labilibaculum antarcticum TaxID=1717717 RepID=A0A1Y1CHZ7_9BACT|nr:MarR family transcriptional regulator [Labilibaculum antarcticum]BAX79910.1 MarR family transcriptional regulator [Labilibaculum antarcticum]